ncbi:MAG TPA: RNA methyltransferase [Acidimicrobiales bacterium]|nr:RNA methyltransferase [Acidimicrobiales bacterium]
MPLVPVDNPEDERLAVYTGLTDGELRRRGDAFVAEGVLVIRRLLESRFPVRSLLATPNRLDPAWAALDVPVYVASQEVMNQVAGFDIHRGALAAGARVPLPPAASLLDGARRVAVLEGINDTENMGALFRNAAAFGLDAVLLTADCCDPLYRRAVRVSMGNVLHVPFTVVDGLDDLRGFTTVALTPAADAEPLGPVPGPVAFLVGAEGSGLRAETLAAADRRMRIPMAPGVDSLNVATAAAIAFYALGSTWRTDSVRHVLGS